MAKVFDVMLMERRADKYVKKELWDSYLLTSFRKNRPLNELAREILAADGVDENNRAAAKFYLEREVEPNLLTREVGRMFFGMDLQCAQCHDHPSIDDYYQSDYYGLFAFVSRSYLFQPDKKKPAVLAEKAEGDAKFKSVFTEEEGATLPRLPGSVEIDEPTFAKEDAYEVKPDPKKKDVRPIPRHSRRYELAMRATDGSNLAFNRNLANRLWAHMMGRGLVHPVDQHHSDNPPVQPQLLELLAAELPQTNFDVKSMLRQLALSRTYQRSVDLPNDMTEHAKSASQQLEVWKLRLAELKTAAEQAGQAVDQLDDQLDAEQAKLPPLVDAEKKASDALAASKRVADDATKALHDSQQVLTKHQVVLDLLAEARAKATQAAGVLGEGDGLGNAITMLQERHQVFAAKVAQQTQQLSALTAAHMAAIAKRSETQKVAEAATNTLKTASDALADTAKKLAAAKQHRLFSQTSISHAKNQIMRLQLIVDYAETLRQANEDAQLVDTLEAQRDSLATAWSEQFSIAVVQPLSPEQLAWSMLHTTGYVDRQRAGVAATLDKKSPLKPEEKKDPAKVAARELEVETQTQAKLKGIVDRFVKLFAAAGGQPQDDFFATVEQALFFRNGGELQSWLAPSSGNLTDRLRKVR